MLSLRKQLTLILILILCILGVQIIQEHIYTHNNVHPPNKITKHISSTYDNRPKGTTRNLRTIEVWTKPSTLAYSKNSTFNVTHAPRLKIPKINKQHKFHFSVKNTIKLMPVIKKDQVIRILLVTYFRAGSTFLGDILQQTWRTFYHFEPLHYMTSNSKISRKQTREALSLMSSLFRCNFNQTIKYNKWVSTIQYQFLLKRNRFLWSICHIHRETCFMPQYLTDFCQRAPIHVMKLTRVHINDALAFIQANKDLNIKLIYLSRDPRAIISSRKVLEWCQRNGCDNPNVLCKNMETDIEELEKTKMPYRWVRYEDLSMNASIVTESIYKWLSIPYTSSVFHFLNTHTRAMIAENKDPYSTRRNSTTAPFEWLHKLSFREIEFMQSVCKTVMEKLGYKNITNSTYRVHNCPDCVLTDKISL